MIGFATSITHFSDPNVETNPNDHVPLDQKDQTNSFRKRKPDIPQVSFQNLHWINTCNVNIHIYTPETDMEPENTPLKRRSIYRPAIFEFHVSFWGCIYPLNYRKWSQMYTVQKHTLLFPVHLHSLQFDTLYSEPAHQSCFLWCFGFVEILRSLYERTVFAFLQCLKKCHMSHKCHIWSVISLLQLPRSMPSLLGNMKNPRILTSCPPPKTRMTPTNQQNPLGLSRLVWHKSSTIVIISESLIAILVAEVRKGTLPQESHEILGDPGGCVFCGDWWPGKVLGSKCIIWLYMYMLKWCKNIYIYNIYIYA